MKDLEALIRSAAGGNEQDFTEIIRRFQDMAYGYAYSLLGDLHLAEDAAQEAFVEAYLNLKRLEHPAAFPGWFRRIIQFRCSRFLKRNKLIHEPLEKAGVKASVEPGPYEIVEKRDIEMQVFNAVNCLTQPLREVTTLFYINGYSRKEIADFLEISEHTVRNRLSASREQLKRSIIMNGIIKETFGSNKPGDFSRTVLEGIKSPFSPVRPGKNKETFWTQRIPFPACLCSCMEEMGEDYGYSDINFDHIFNFNKRNSNHVVHYNNLYMLLLCASGLAFSLVWNSGKWDYLDYAAYFAFPEPLTPYANAFEAAGYEYKIISNKDMILNFPQGQHDSVQLIQKADYAFFRECIIKNIHELKRPLLASGVVHASEYCLITGYDKNAEVLIGWSPFQLFPEHHPDVKIDLEPSGYFRQRDWYFGTPSLIIVENKSTKPSSSEIYKKSLKLAVTAAHTEEVFGRKAGLAAYNALADDLLKDKYFPADNINLLYERFSRIDNVFCLKILEGRWYAGAYMKKIAESRPEFTNELKKASECYFDIYNLGIECYYQLFSDAMGVFPMPFNVQRLADRGNREKAASLLMKIRDKDAEAVSIIDEILKKW